MATKYILEVNEPNDPSTVLGSLESDTPFMAISTGDIIMAGTFNPSLPLSSRLKVTSVRAYLYEIDGAVMHKIVIFTQPNQ